MDDSGAVVNPQIKFNSMISINKTAETLHDLILINNDRTEGYEKALTLLPDSDQELKEMFEEFAEESRFYVEDLHEMISLLGTEDGVESTTASGKIYRVWMDIKNAITGADRESILASCEFGEDAAQKEYSKALDNADFMDENTRAQIEWQKESLKISHDLIKTYRDLRA